MAVVVHACNKSRNKRHSSVSAEVEVVVVISLSLFLLQYFSSS